MKSNFMPGAVVGLALLAFALWEISQQCSDGYQAPPPFPNITSPKLQSVSVPCRIAVIKPEQPELSYPYSMSPSSLLSPMVASGTTTSMSPSISPSPSPEPPKA